MSTTQETTSKVLKHIELISKAQRPCPGPVDADCGWEFCEECRSKGHTYSQDVLVATWDDELDPESARIEHGGIQLGRLSVSPGEHWNNGNAGLVVSGLVVTPAGLGMTDDRAGLWWCTHPDRTAQLMAFNHAEIILKKAVDPGSCPYCNKAKPAMEVDAEVTMRLFAEMDRDLHKKTIDVLERDRLAVHEVLMRCITVCNASSQEAREEAIEQLRIQIHMYKDAQPAIFKAVYGKGNK